MREIGEERRGGERKGDMAFYSDSLSSNDIAVHIEEMGISLCYPIV